MKSKKLRHILAFSLIELLISLIAISSVTAAFAPVISKRLSGSILGVAGGSKTSNKTCANSNCVACQSLSTGEVCLVCSNDKTSCSNGSFVRTSNCSCTGCNNATHGYGEGCASCDSSGCLQCSAGYYLNDKQCSSCPAGYYCEDGKKKQQCPKGYQCPAGSASPSLCSANSFALAGSSACTSCAATQGSTPGSAGCMPCANLFGAGCIQCNETGCTNVSSAAEYDLTGGISSSKNHAVASGLSNISAQQANILAGLNNINAGVANMAAQQQHTANSINMGMANIASAITNTGGVGGSSSSGVQKMMLVHNCDAAHAPHCTDGCNSASNSCLGCAKGFGLHNGMCHACWQVPSFTHNTGTYLYCWTWNWQPLVGVFSHQTRIDRCTSFTGCTYLTITGTRLLNESHWRLHWAYAGDDSWSYECRLHDNFTMHRWYLTMFTVSCY